VYLLGMVVVCGWCGVLVCCDVVGKREMGFCDGGVVEWGGVVCAQCAL